MPLPELEDDNVLLAVHTSGVQHKGLELPLLQITVTLGAPLLPVAQECDVSVPPVHMKD
jgi:hypothetical protein